MATFRDMLKAINAYPIPHSTITSVCVGRGVDPEAEATKEGMQGADYRLARADLMLWLADAPNIAQGGQNYSFSEDQRDRFRNEAQSVLDELEPETSHTKYGYKGSRL